MKTLYLTNIPAPYREKFHEIIYNKLSKKYLVVYCANIEPNRKWKFKKGKYKKINLNIKQLIFKNRYIYFNLNIITLLRKVNPGVIVLNGLSPVMIIAFIWAKLKGAKVIASTDANVFTENRVELDPLQILLRKLIYPNCDAFVGASTKTKLLYKKYKSNIKNKFFETYYSYPIKKNKLVSINKRQFDIILCGQFIKRKKFFFALEIISNLHKVKNKLKVKIIGDGPLKKLIIQKIKKIGVAYEYKGFVQPKNIIKEFSNAKIFLFPTSSDGWGVVANESCIAGTPVITCNNAGAANELIINNLNGFVINLNVKKWTKKILYLLNNKKKLKLYSLNAINHVKKFDSKVSANNLIKAIKACEN